MSLVLCCLFPESCSILILVWYQAFQCRLFISNISRERHQENLDLEIEAATVRPQNEKLIGVEKFTLTFLTELKRQFGCFVVCHNEVCLLFPVSMNFNTSASMHFFERLVSLPNILM